MPVICHSTVFNHSHVHNLTSCLIKENDCFRLPLFGSLIDYAHVLCYLVNFSTKSWYIGCPGSIAYPIRITILITLQTPLAIQHCVLHIVQIILSQAGIPWSFMDGLWSKFYGWMWKTESEMFTLLLWIYGYVAENVRVPSRI